MLPEISLLTSAIITAMALVALYFWRHSRRLARRQSHNDRAGSGKEAIHTESSLPDPDPLFDFDLETTTARNYVYANKTVRHPYYQVRSVPCILKGDDVHDAPREDDGASAYARQLLDRD